MNPRLAVAASFLSVLPLMAAAQPITGPYVGAGAGINLWHDSTSRGFRIHDDDIGFVGLGSLGFGFGIRSYGSPDSMIDGFSFSRMRSRRASSFCA